MNEQQAQPSGNPTAALAAVGLSLDVFEGPFDLLITLILNEEVDLLEVHLADIVLAYIERLEERGELDLEAATEFLILIAALLELKSRLMLPGEEPEGLDLERIREIADRHRFGRAEEQRRDLSRERPHVFSPAMISISPKFSRWRQTTSPVL